LYRFIISLKQKKYFVIRNSIQILILVSLQIFSFGVLLAQKQTTIDESFLQDFIENLESDQAFDFNTLLEHLQFRAERPININRASEEDLYDLIILSEIEINAILEYRRQHGDFISKHELQAVPNLELIKIRSLLPFINVNGEDEIYNLPISTMLKDGRSELFLRWSQTLETQEGFKEDEFGEKSYQGDPSKLYMRYSYKYEDKMRIGFTGEKDPGESFFSGSNKTGFDFYSAHIHFRDAIPHIKDIVIGDYSISLGQGLILHNAFGRGKGSDVTRIKKGGRTLQSYSSVNEANFFRGAAASFHKNDFELTLFGSFRPIDGNVRFLDTLENEDVLSEFSSIIDDGFHRTALEIEKENAIKRFSTGGRLVYKRDLFKVGFNALYESFNQNFSPNNQLFNRFRFSGNSLLNASFDYSYKYKNINAFGEFAMSDNGGIAFNQGLLIGLDRKLDLAIMYRDYGPDYQNLSSNSFGETQGTNNENGLYLGVEFRPDNHWNFKIYADQWKHPWLRFRRDAPSTGHEYLFRASYTKRRKWNAYLQWRIEQKQINNSEIETPIDRLTNLNLHRLRFHVAYNVSPSVELRNRAEFSFYEEDDFSSNGFLVYQDFLFSPLSSPFSMSARLAYFNTQDFDSRIYTFENDLIFNFSIPFFQGKGYRYYLNARYDVSRVLTAEFRIAQVHFDNASAIISTGNNLIIGDTKTDAKIQLRLRF